MSNLQAVRLVAHIRGGYSVKACENMRYLCRGILAVGSDPNPRVAAVCAG
jgi:hypothetical protein